MATSEPRLYFVRRAGAVGGKAVPQLWHDCDVHPTKFTEHKLSVIMCHEVTTKDIADAGIKGVNVLDYMSAKYPEPEEAREIETYISEEVKQQ